MAKHIELDVATESRLSRDLLIGAAAGLIAMAPTGAVDRLLGRLISPEQRKRERKLRKGTPHTVAGPFFGRKLLGRKLTPSEEKNARRLFTLGYGAGWGLLYALIRRKIPRASRLRGLPFAVPFFFVCDGGIAPLLELSPTLGKVPWQFNAKELANHVAWTMAAETVFRQGERIG